MIDYSNGKIYKIEVEGMKPYIGSTSEKKLCYRFSGHKRQYRYYVKTGKGGNCKSFDLLKEEGCVITLIETYPCNSVEELKARERYWIDNIDCINKARPTISVGEKKSYQKDYYENNKDYLIQKSTTHYHNNIEKHKSRNKEYYKSNKEHIKENTNSFYHNNKEHIKEYRKEYREKNREKIKLYQQQYREKKRLEKSILI